MSAQGSFSTAFRLAQDITNRYGKLLEVEAVALAGSQVAQVGDSSSDIDLYVYCQKPIGLEARRGIASPARHSEIGNEFWEPGDEWVDAETGISVDVMFRDMKWIEERIDHVLVRFRASVGYSTCFWFNVRNSEVLFDRAGWFERLKQKAQLRYPTELKHAVIAKNFPILRQNQSSYMHQIELAIARRDFISVQHRTAALLASYFDILFTVNEQPHPGEKRLVEHAKALCAKLPENFPVAVESLLECTGTEDQQALRRAGELVDGLESLLRREGLCFKRAGELTALP